MNASKPTLITTFIGIQALTPLIDHLARPEIEGGLGLDQEEAGEWKNHNESIFAIALSHQELADVTLMQLVINPGGEAPDAWQRATAQLERAMRDLPEESEEALLGITLVYQAVLPPNADPDDSVVSLLDQYKLSSSGAYLYLRPLASSEVRGGKLWLLESATQDLRNVYLALGTEAEQETLTYDVLFDEDAALLWADTIAHKAYYMLRNYRAEAERHVYRQANKTLTERVQTILEENLLPIPTDSETHEPTTGANNNPLAQLNDLSSKAAKFTNATVTLHQLQSDLEIHRFNLKLAAQHFASQACADPSCLGACSGSMAQDTNPITNYHLQRLNHNLFRIRQDLAVASATQEAVNTAINYLRAIEEHEQTVLAEQQKKANRRLEIMIAFFSLIIGVGQIIDDEPITMLMRFVVMVAIGLVAWRWYQGR